MRARLSKFVLSMAGNASDILESMPNTYVWLDRSMWRMNWGRGLKARWERGDLVRGAAAAVEVGLRLWPPK